MRKKIIIKTVRPSLESTYEEIAKDKKREKKALELAEALLARVSMDNLHHEVDTGPTVGNETW
jgi:antitoxin component of MazEF toxin-antitoxin module